MRTAAGWCFLLPRASILAGRTAHYPLEGSAEGTFRLVAEPGRDGKGGGGRVLTGGEGHSLEPSDAKDAATRSWGVNISVACHCARYAGWTLLSLGEGGIVGYMVRRMP